MPTTQVPTKDDAEVKFPLSNLETYRKFLLGQGARKVEDYRHNDEIFIKPGWDMARDNFRLRVCLMVPPQSNADPAQVAQIKNCSVVYSSSTEEYLEGVYFKMGTKQQDVEDASYGECIEYLQKHRAKHQFTIEKLTGEEYELPPFVVNIEQIGIRNGDQTRDIGYFSEIEGRPDLFIENIRWVRSFLKNARIGLENLISIPFCAHIKKELEL